MKPSNRMLVGAAVLSVLTAAGAFHSSDAQVTQVNGKVTLKQADGSVTVNDAPLAKGGEIASGSAITTRQNSSAVVSLGKLGRVEVLPETSLKLGYTASTFTVEMLDSGRVRISSSPSAGATATTNDGSVVADTHQRTEFLVDTTCGDTFVSVSKGSVSLRAGDTVKQIAAGNQDSAGTARPGCTRRN